MTKKFSHFSVSLITFVFLFVFQVNSQSIDFKGPESYKTPVSSSFGSSVARSGDYVVVGGSLFWSRSGIAYVLHKEEQDWRVVAYLRSSDALYNDYMHFGAKVHFVDDVIMVQANHSIPTPTNPHLYIFEKPENGWENMTETARLTFSGLDFDFVDLSPGSDFNGELAVAKANVKKEDIWTTRVVVFEKPEDGWSNMTETAVLNASDLARHDSFGIAVAISGNLIGVGSPGDDDNGDLSGSVYLFEKPETGWADMTETAKIKPSNGAAKRAFGRSIDIEGNTVVVGSSLNNEPYGRAYVFEKPESGWINETQEVAELSATDDTEGGEFGRDIAISDGVVAVGSFGWDFESGGIYLYEKPDEGWVSKNEDFKLTAKNYIHGDQIGEVLDFSGDLIISGAYSYGDHANGAVYFFERSGERWQSSHETYLLKAENSVAHIFNHTGYTIDMDSTFSVYGAPGYQDQEGLVYLNKLDDDGWTTVSHLQLTDPVAHERLGIAVAISGETVVASTHPVDTTNGRVFVFHIADQTKEILPIAELKISDDEHIQGFGSRLAVSDSLILIGAPSSDVSGDSSGIVFLYQKPAEGWTDMTETTTLLGSEGENKPSFGASLSISQNNITIGAPGTGKVFYFQKPANGWNSIVDPPTITASEEEFFGRSIAESDSLIVIGSKGKALIFKKETDELKKIASLTPSTTNSGLDFGHDLDFSMNQIVVGSYNQEDQSGAAFLYVRPHEGWIDSEEDSILLPSDELVAKGFGREVAISASNMLVSAHLESRNGFESGCVYFFENCIDHLIFDSYDYDDVYSECEIELIPPTATDNCGNIYYGETDVSFPFQEYGTTTITWKFIDSYDQVFEFTQNLHIYPPTDIVVSSDSLIAKEGAYSYQWYKCESDNPIPDEQNFYFIPNESGSYKVEISTEECLISSNCEEIEVITSVEDYPELIIYPNPASNFLQIDSKKVPLLQVWIYDMSGAQIMTRTENLSMLDISMLKNGLYTIAIKSSMEISHFRFVKNN